MVVNKENQELNDAMGNKTARVRRHKESNCEPMCGDSEKVVDYGKITQWTTGDGKRFVPAGTTKELLPPGVYEIHHSSSIGLFFQKVLVRTEGLLRFPETNSEKVLKEIEVFWNREKYFTEYDIAYKRGIILWGPPGCHAKGTLIRMFDGSVKKVEDIKVGNLLMGPDSKSRKVLELKNGSQMMYKITPTKSKPFVVNKDHILHLEWSGKRENKNNINISIRDYLKLSTWQKNRYKLKYSRNISKVPCEIAYKCSGMISSNKNNLRTGFNIEEVGVGKYYGFTLNKDHLYLTSDYIIHHNSGKTCTVNLIMKDVVDDRDGVVIKFTNPGLFIEGVRVLREIQPNTPVVVLMEDIDSIIDHYEESPVLNILDGVENIYKMVFLATTNYPELLGPRIINRPSRFDKRFKIPYPNSESREMYLKHLCKEKPPQDLNIDIKKWVKDTENFSIAHIKELFVAVVILGDEYKEALENLTLMKEIVTSTQDVDRRVGFSATKSTY